MKRGMLNLPAVLLIIFGVMALVILYLLFTPHLFENIFIRGNEDYSYGTSNVKEECIPDCDGIQCGIDPLCGVLCGECEGMYYCLNRTCVINESLSNQCITNLDKTTCLGSVCGNKINNCGQEVNCGVCSLNQTCMSGICINQSNQDQFVTQNCSIPFLGDINAPLKVIFVGVGNISRDSSEINPSASYEEVRDATIASLMTISPFKENFNLMGFHFLNLSGIDSTGPPLNCLFSLDNPHCNNTEIYNQIEKKCQIDNPLRQITILLGRTNLPGAEGGDIIAISTYSFLSNTSIHEIGHKFGLGDLYPFWPRNESFGSPYGAEIESNLDIAGCPKWCQSYKPISQYPTTSLSSQCLKFTNKNDCASYGRAPSGDCRTDSESHLQCCVWSDQKFYYFNTNCVPSQGTDNIGINCLENSGCYFGGHSSYSWQPIINYSESIMYDPNAEKFDAVSERAIDNVFECCFPPLSSSIECINLRTKFFNYQGGNYHHIGYCGV